MRYAHHRVAVRAALPLDPERAVPYVHHRVAVYGALPSTFTDEWQCTVCRQVRVINVFHMLADLLGGHPGPGAGEPRVGGRRQSPAWRSARPAGTQGASLARAVSGSAWPHASAQAISPLDLRNESSRNASPNDTASAVPVARALRLLAPPAPCGAGPNSPVARSQGNIPRSRLRYTPRALSTTHPRYTRSSFVTLAPPRGPDDCRAPAAAHDVARGARPHLPWDG